MTSERCILFYYKYVQGITDLTLLNQPKPPEDFDWFDLDRWILDEFDNVLSRQPNLGRLPTIRTDDVRSWKAFLAGLIAYIVWLAELATMIATLIEASIARLATTPVRYLLWQLSRVLYQLYDSARTTLVISGFVHPTRDHVRKYFQNLTNPNPNFYFEFNSPYLHVVNEEQTYHLVHPKDVPMPGREKHEGPTTKMMGVDSQPNFQNVDTIFFDVSGVPLPPQLYGLCFNTGDLPFITVADLGIALVRQFELDGGLDLPNMNMDGDRGFGWLTWVASNPRPWNDMAAFEFCSPL